MYQILCNDALLGRLDKSWLDELNKQDMFEKGEYQYYLDLIETDKPRLAREYLEKISTYPTTMDLGDWVEIRLADGSVGWMPENCIEII